MQALKEVNTAKRNCTASEDSCEIDKNTDEASPNCKRKKYCEPTGCGTTDGKNVKDILTNTLSVASCSMDDYLQQVVCAVSSETYANINEDKNQSGVSKDIGTKHTDDDSSKQMIEGINSLDITDIVNCMGHPDVLKVVCTLLKDAAKSNIS